MPVDPQVQPILDLLDQVGFTLDGQDPDTVRQVTASMIGTAVDVPLARVEDRTVPTATGGVPVRVYTPAAALDAEHGAAALIWIHGGGWVIGSVDESDSTARLLADRSGVVVISVEYRLAPEHPFPAGSDDCEAVLHWTVTHAAELGIDPARLAIGGDSAGGNLAALTAIHARDAGIELRQQLLVYPATDLTATHPSVDENGEGYLLTKAAMHWFMGHYLGDHDPKDPRVSPLYVDDLSGVAPAVIYTAEFDPLRDEGEAYAARLLDAGVTVDQQRWDGQIHGFFGFHGTLDASDRALERAASSLRAAVS
jgi:acetyl esterase